jgi:hypothetical protein
MNLQEGDREAAAVAKAPRVSLADIEGAIAGRYHVTGAEAIYSAALLNANDLKSLNVLSICILVLHNGFTIIGKSAPASPENFNTELGRKLAYEDCIRQLWPLMGFALREKLHASQK